MPQTVAQMLNQSARMLAELQANQSLDADTIDNVMFPVARDWLNSLAGIVTGTDEIVFDQTVNAATILGAGNVRLKCTASAAVTLPAAAQDGWRIIAGYVAAGQTLTINPNGNKIDGATANAAVTAGNTDEWMFRADISDWVSTFVSASGNSVPWPDQFLLGLAAQLAIEIQPVLGLPLKPDTRARAAMCEKAMVGRYFRKNPLLYRNWRYQAPPVLAAADAA